ncbi:hypothetical protein CWB41_14945 [Methylovirgula ligni]|nr:hypothetical protein CWB41_14945 [Methylovirgula ligni]
MFAWLFPWLWDFIVKAFPSLWTGVLTGLAIFAASIIGIVSLTPVVLWLPIALCCGILALALAHLWRWWHRSGVGVHDRPIAELKNEELRNRATQWLKSKLSNNGLHVREANLFGSILHDNYPTNDVDVVIEYKPISERQIAAHTRQIRERVAAEFERTFGKRLHATFFCANEGERREQFFARAGEHEVVFSES